MAKYLPHTHLFNMRCLATLSHHTQAYIVSKLLREPLSSLSCVINKGQFGYRTRARLNYTAKTINHRAYLAIYVLFFDIKIWGPLIWTLKKSLRLQIIAFFNLMWSTQLFVLETRAKLEVLGEILFSYILYCYFAFFYKITC